MKAIMIDAPTGESFTLYELSGRSQLALDLLTLLEKLERQYSPQMNPVYIRLRTFEAMQ